MSPTVRHDATVDLDVVRGTRPRRATRYAVAVLAAAVALFVGLAVAGMPLPRPGPLLLLAIPLALCMNRFVFFPNETGVTADAAVLFAAMVAFRGDAAWLGPLGLALLVGPLDARHWGTRSFARMAYNSGSTALVTAAGLAVFVPVGHTLGSGWGATVAAAAIASLPYVVSESVLGVVLVVLLGETPRTAIGHQVPLNAIAVPLAIVGATAGLTALDVGWWCAFLLLLPMPWVPELVFVIVPRRLRSSSSSAFVAVAATALVLLGFGSGTSRWSVLAGLIAVGVLAGLDGRWARWVPFPVLGLVALVPALVVPTAQHRMVAVLVVVAVTAVVSWWHRGARRTSWAAVLWCVPLVAAAGCAARVWRDVDRGGAPVFAAMAVVALAVAAAWGAPPWGSRCIGRWSTRHLDARRHTILVVLTAVTLGSAAVALVDGDARSMAGLVAAWAAQVVMGCALVAVHQWRFSPRRRAVEATVLVVGSLVATVTVAGFVVVPVAIWIAAGTPRVDRPRGAPEVDRAG